MPSITDFLWSSRILEKDVLIKSSVSLKKGKEGRPTYASFGDGGLTVSVNAYGNIMQISRFVNSGPSGFLCVDSRFDQPWYVERRMQNIAEASVDRQRGLRLDLLNWTGQDGRPDLEFVYDRWPRYDFPKRKGHNPSNKDPKSTFAKANVKSPARSTEGPEGPVTESQISPVSVIYSSNDVRDTPTKPGLTSSASTALPLSIQYFCHGETVLQTYQISLRDLGTSGPILGSRFRAIRLANDFIIRGLDFTKLYGEEDDDAYQKEHDLHLVDDKTVVILHTMPHLDSDDHNEEHSSDGDSKPFEKHTSVPKVVVAFIISAFINGDPATIVENNGAHYMTIPESWLADQLEITVAYTLRLLDKGTTYALDNPNPESGDFDDLLGQIILGSNASTFAAAEQDTGHEVTKNTSSQESNVTVSEDKEVRKDQGPKWYPPGHAAHAMAESASELSEESRFRKICFDKDKELDFMFRRHLEHILSVCCIPEPSLAVGPEIEDSPMAITCGDVSGHRIGPRASLCV